MQGDFTMKKEEVGEKNSLKEAVQLEIELEKRKIREEIIASEIIQKRKELETEVRMELMMEKQTMGMRNVYRDSSVFDDMNSYRCLGFDGRSYLNNSLMNVGNSEDEKLRLLSHHHHHQSVIGGGSDSFRFRPELCENNVLRDGEKREVDGGVSVGKPPFERDLSLVAARFAGKSVADLDGEEVLDQAMPISRIAGMKRKAETSPIAVSDEEAASVACKSLHNNWYCPLCDVSATSAGGLNLHLHGKKHKAKEAISKSGDIASSISTGSFTEKVMQTTEQSEIEKSQVRLMEEQRSQVQMTEGKESQIELMEEEKSKLTKKWECSLCQISVTSEVLLNSHLQGKKHQAKEAISKSGATNSYISTDSFCAKNLIQTMGQSDTLVQPIEEEKDQVQLVEEARSQVQLMGEDKSQVTKKWECSLCQISVTSEILLKSHLQGKKHKAKEVKFGIFQGTSDKCTGTMMAKGDTVSKWYCSVCQVLAPSEKNLNDHFRGKKHKAKAGLVNLEADTVDSKSTEQISEYVKTVQDNNLEVNDSLNNDQEPSKSQVSEQEIVNGSNIVKFWHCKMCNEGTYDETTMAYHRKSSKHMDMLQKTGGGLIVVSNVTKEAFEGGKASQHASLLKDNEIETEN